MKSFNRAIANTRTPALEDLVDGKTRDENEHVFYARIVNFEELKRASVMIKQEQWEIRVKHTAANLGAGQLRVRKSITDNLVEYEFTIKTKKSDGNRFENSNEISAEGFEMFRQLAECGMIKHRYEFPSGQAKPWQVDVFLRPDGTYYNYCKIDLEVDDMSLPLPAFPIQLEEVIREIGDKMPAEQRSKVTKLYDEYFITRPSMLTK